jgi:uncharacterized membrane protein YkvA (DUF1232 family)
MGLKRLIREARVGSHTLWLALQDERTPSVARVLALVVLAYALSPIDLIPDFLPVIGLLDDALLIPIGVAVVLKLLPDEVRVEARARAEAEADERPRWPKGAVVVALTWLAFGGVAVAGVWRAWTAAS